jgi:hypothetical protein
MRSWPTCRRSEAPLLVRVARPRWKRWSGLPLSKTSLGLSGMNARPAATSPVYLRRPNHPEEVTNERKRALSSRGLLTRSSASSAKRVVSGCLAGCLLGHRVALAGGPGVARPRRLRDSGHCIAAGQVASPCALMRPALMARKTVDLLMPAAADPASAGHFFSLALPLHVAHEHFFKTCSRKKRIISRLASGPRGSVYEPAGLPPDHAWPAS